LYDKYFNRQPESSILVNTSGGNMLVDRLIFWELGGFLDMYTTASDSLFSVLARSKGIEVIYGFNVVVFHPVDGIIKRIRGEMREGRGSVIKDGFKKKIEMVCQKKQSKFIPLRKLQNLFFIIRDISSKTFELRNQSDVSILELFQVIFLAVALKLIGYFSVFMNNNFPALSSKLARR
jgi:hypothetical protein